MARPKSALRKALEEKAAIHAAAAEAAAASTASGSTSTSDWEQTSNWSTPAETPESTNSNNEHLTENGKSIAAELERLSTPGITACNNRDWGFTSPEARECLEHVDPNFEANFDGYPRPLTFEENIATNRELMEKDPSYHMNVMSVTSDVDEASGEASVVLEIEACWTDVKMQGFSELKWRRDEVGKWWCYLHTGMRGTNANAGFI